MADNSVKLGKKIKSNSVTGCLADAEKANIR